MSNRGSRSQARSLRSRQGFAEVNCRPDTKLRLDLSVVQQTGEYDIKQEGIYIR